MKKLLSTIGLLCLTLQVFGAASIGGGSSVNVTTLLNGTALVASNTPPAVSYIPNQFPTPLRAIDGWNSFLNTSGIGSGCFYGRLNGSTLPNLDYETNTVPWTIAIIDILATNLYAGGWNALFIPDGWQGLTRDANGSLTWDTAVWTNSGGLPAILSKAHTQNVFVIGYTSAYGTTCKGLVGSGINNIAQDITNMMALGFDGTMIDTCDNSVMNQPYLQQYYRIVNGAVQYWHSLTISTNGAIRPFYVQATLNNNGGPDVWVPEIMNECNSIGMDAYMTTASYYPSNCIQSLYWNTVRSQNLMNGHPNMFWSVSMQSLASPNYPWTNFFEYSAFADTTIRVGLGNIGDITNATFTPIVGEGGNGGLGHTMLTNVWDASGVVMNPELWSIMDDYARYSPQMLYSNASGAVLFRRKMMDGSYALLFCNQSGTGNVAVVAQPWQWGAYTNVPIYSVRDVMNKTTVSNIVPTVPIVISVAPTNFNLYRVSVLPVIYTSAITNTGMVEFDNNDFATVPQLLFKGQSAGYGGLWINNVIGLQFDSSRHTMNNYANGNVIYDWGTAGSSDYGTRGMYQLQLGGNVSIMGGTSTTGGRAPVNSQSLEVASGDAGFGGNVRTTNNFIGMSNNPSWTGYTLLGNGNGDAFTFWMSNHSVYLVMTNRANTKVVITLLGTAN